MNENWKEKIDQLDQKVAELNEKAKAAAEDAKAAKELGKEALDDKVGTVRGDVEAMKENLRIQGEKDKSKLSSALLKAQMTVEAKIQEMRAARDKRDIERYVEHSLDYIDSCYASALFLIGNADLAILEMLEAIAEYDQKYGNSDSAE